MALPWAYFYWLLALEGLNGSLSLFLFEEARGLGQLELFCLVGWHRLKFWLSRHIWCHFAEFGEREASVGLTPSPEVDV